MPRCKIVYTVDMSKNRLSWLPWSASTNKCCETIQVQAAQHQGAAALRSVLLLSFVWRHLRISFNASRARDRRFASSSMLACAHRVHDCKHDCDGCAPMPPHGRAYLPGFRAVASTWSDLYVFQRTATRFGTSGCLGSACLVDLRSSCCGVRAKTVPRPCAVLICGSGHHSANPTPVSRLRCGVQEQAAASGTRCVEVRWPLCAVATLMHRRCNASRRSAETSGSVRYVIRRYSHHHSSDAVVCLLDSCCCSMLPTLPANSSAIVRVLRLSELRKSILLAVPVIADKTETDFCFFIG